MSKIGKVPVIIPAGVTVTLANNIVNVKGKLGELSFEIIPTSVSVEVKENEVVVKQIKDDIPSHAMWGTTRAYINNMV
ncbi:MAG: 50S ribosomal protein L6, partial [Rickettsiales bacterium]|nr:50S ribosomal protein L6 [Rickettsiales bacterium]